MRILYLALTLLLATPALFACTELTIEEKRLAEAAEQLPEVVSRYDETVETFKRELRNSPGFDKTLAMTTQYAEALWQIAVKDLQASDSTFDDRPLYWARLKMTKALRTEELVKPLEESQIHELETIIDQVSRGYSTLSFNQDSDIKILITGFDPFLLDRNIKQSNPSGVAALRLDNTIIESGDKTIEIQAAMFPVRYQDFDEGIVEKVVEPFLENNSIDMLATISMGREHFDLEHFPGRRRSSSAPDNNNIYSGGSAAKPVIGKIGEKHLEGPEFVEFSLPYEAMMKTEGKYKINDNREVTTIEKTFKPNSLEELKDAIAVEGGGGGYLSNEISYRTVNLGNKLGTKVPTGHIHTPRIKEFDKTVIKEIVEQIKEMLVNGVTQPEK
ncbi:C15 family peptidase [Kangiella geojedonensis]|uniref:Pyrrolidone-carboxylate peptidase n=1 Tax=Kangiella geojedonensis TaxID=914150 RepID=A0A0F6RBV2_9GAMM|nr:hypothetical protein [Kangiella geojedonensis]AKE51863.1 hypothetical protein TQ33_0895 [Kangiella geojedonensis]